MHQALRVIYFLVAEIFSADHFPSVEGGASSKKIKHVSDWIRMRGSLEIILKANDGVYECHDMNRFKVIALLITGLTTAVICEKELKVL